MNIKIAIAMFLSAVVCGGIFRPAHAWQKQWDAPRISDTCVTYDARYSEAPLFIVTTNTADERVYFHPAKKAVTAKSYLVKGDVVFAGPEDGGFRCVYYGNARGQLTAGFIPVANLATFEETEVLSKEFLIGTWTNGGNPKIVIVDAGSNKVKATGKALWYGLGDNVHLGGFSAVTSVQDKELEFREGSEEYACVVKILRRGPYIVAVDNAACGGMNVRFSSILMKLQIAKKN